MKSLATIRDTDFGTGFPDPAAYTERLSARAVVFDADGNVALFHSTGNGYHKLPGGGAEEGEDIPTALARELAEEIGCAVENVRELGIIEEFRNKFALHQVSHCFMADVAGAKGIPCLDEGEQAEGFETVWVPLQDAIAIVENETGIGHYEGRFIRSRDLAFLKEAARSH